MTLTLLTLTLLTLTLRVASVCQNLQMLDRRKWIDRMQPQTLQIATWLLYINGFFALVELVDGGGVLHYFKERYAFGFFLGLAIVSTYIVGGFLMANERKAGWKISVIAAASPFVLTYIAYSQIGASLRYRIFGGSLLSFAFDAALLALLVHPQSREHQRIWYH